MLRQLTLFTLAFLFSIALSAQFRIGMIPRVSPDVDVIYTVSYTDIGIHYNSPSVKGRKIWGELVPYNKVWRAGANEATSFDFSHDVRINGKLMPKGSYSFFVIPKKNEPWVIIFNKAAKQLGAFGYDAGKDFLRLEIAPQQVSTFSERLKYEIIQKDHGSASLTFNWEHIQLSLNIEVDYVTQLVQTIDSVLAETKEEFKWAIYFQGAEFLLKTNQKTDLALQWVDASLAGRKFSDSYWVKAQLLSKQNRFKEATTVIHELKNLAKATKKETIYDEKKAEIDAAFAKWSAR